MGRLGSTTRLSAGGLGDSSYSPEPVCHGTKALDPKSALRVPNQTEGIVLESDKDCSSGIWVYPLLTHRVESMYQNERYLGRGEVTVWHDMAPCMDHNPTWMLWVDNLVAVIERKLSYYNPKTIFLTIHPYYGNLIYVP